MHYIEESKKSVQEIVESIQNIVSNYGFGVLHIHNVKNTLNSKGIDFEDECQILDVCNPNVAKEFLSQDMSLSDIISIESSPFLELKIKLNNGYNCVILVPSNRLFINGYLVIRFTLSSSFALLEISVIIFNSEVDVTLPSVSFPILIIKPG